MPIDEHLHEANKGPVRRHIMPIDRARGGRHAMPIDEHLQEGAHIMPRQGGGTTAVMIRGGVMPAQRGASPRRVRRGPAAAGGMAEGVAS